MKPRTKLQYEVLQNSKQLRSIEDEVLSWAKKECLDHKGYATKNRVICLDCGNSFSPTLVNRKKATCPHCSTKLVIEQTKKRTAEQRTYVAYASLFGDFQVIRNFELRSYHKSGEKTRYFIDEILQHWILSNGKREVVARRHTVNWYCNSWGGYMEIQNKNYERKYDVYPQKYHPNSIFKSEYQKYGINKNLEGLTFLEATKFIPGTPKAETLLKAKQYDLLGYSYNNFGQVSRYWNAIKICLRNKYLIKDAKFYMDYLYLLQYFRKDLHNAFYVCPKNLKKEHDLLVAKRRKHYAKLEAERKREKQLKDTKIFTELKSKFFGLYFSSNNIEVRMLESVEEVMHEGDVLCHCVFTNEYYLKSDSLILSATVDGKKTETVEVSLKQLKVVQCRGLQNTNTEYHEQIISLVNKNMHLIEERLKENKNGTKQNVSRISQAVDLAV